MGRRNLQNARASRYGRKEKGRDQRESGIWYVGKELHKNQVGSPVITILIQVKG